jgi:hypothetical protein
VSQEKVAFISKPKKMRLFRASGPKGFTQDPDMIAGWLLFLLVRFGDGDGDNNFVEAMNDSRLGNGCFQSHFVIPSDLGDRCLIGGIKFVHL